MATRHIWKVSLLTAILIFGATGAQAESSNPEDGSQSQETEAAAPPCNFILVGTSEPYVDIIWYCLGNGP